MYYSKTEYLTTDPDNNLCIDEDWVRIKKVESFRYLELIIELMNHLKVNVSKELNKEQ